MKTLKNIALVGTAGILNIAGVFSLGGAFDIAAGLGYADPLNPTFRIAAGVFGLSAIVLALRLWAKGFGVDLGQSE